MQRTFTLSTLKAFYQTDDKYSQSPFAVEKTKNKIGLLNDF